MKSFAGNGAECSTRLKTQLEAAFPGSQVSMDDPQTEEGKWSQSIAVRRGMWSGVDVEFKESEGRKTVEASAGSRGGSALILGAVVSALVLSFMMGDWLLRLVGIEGFGTSLTMAIGTIPFLIVTVSVAMVAQGVLGKGGAAESEQMVQRVNAMLDELA